MARRTPPRRGRLVENFLRPVLDVVAAGGPPLHHAKAQEALQRPDVAAACAAAGSSGFARPI